MTRRADLLLRLALIPGLLGLGYRLFGQTASSTSSLLTQSSAPQTAPDQPQASRPKQPDKATASNETSADTRSAEKAKTGNQEQASEKQESNEPTPAGRKLHWRLGTVTVGGSYTYFSNGFVGPFCCYGFYPYGAFYSPWYWPDLAFGPWDYMRYGPYGPVNYPHAGGFGYAPDKGEIRLSTDVKHAQVYIDGAYAGTADDLRDMWITPGAYDLSVSAPGRKRYQERVYVLTGKTVKLKARLEPEQPGQSKGEQKP